MLGELKNQIYPLSLTPIMSERPWGQRKPSAYYESDSQANWGEIFLAVRDYGLTSRIATGPLSGQPIHKIGQTWGRELADPPGAVGWPIPFTVWLERTGDGPSPVRVKSGPEFWLVLESDPDSWLGAGLEANQNSWPQKLSRRLTEPGEVLIMPAGLPHAQGPAMTVLKACPVKIGLETLYNWDRRPDAWDYQSPPGYQVPQTSEPPVFFNPLSKTDGYNLLAQGPGITVHLLNTTFQAFKGGRFSIICPIKGQGRLNSSGAFPTIRLRPGGATLIPSGLGPHSIVSNSSLSAVMFSGPNHNG
ncbi:MAG: hypothetical protein LBP22_04860 [Deltaproteobacteria bacterium]|jgi:hypothetical protein|nr:hypothetical protein [Deltaproteobacteria bacterium]